MVDAIPVVPPKEAIDFFREKGLATGFAWQDVWQDEHARAFTVAKAMSRDLLEDIRWAVDKALADGTTLDQFRKELRPLLERRGWWGRRSMVDPLTGEQKIVQLGSPRRLKTIFEVNMRSAYAAGRWIRAERTKAGFPFLRYVTAGDSRVRPEHRAWHGTIRPIGDAFWDTHYPPCGWNCRCEAVPISKSKMERSGWKVTEDPPSFPKLPYLNPRSGEVVKIERGIDPGFSFNIGKAYLDSLAPRPVGGSTPGAPAMVAAEKALMGALGIEKGQSKIFYDRSGWPLAIGPAWLRSVAGRAMVPGPVPDKPAEAAAQLAMVGRAIADPAEIRLAWIRAENGEELLVRRYFGIEGKSAVMVETGRAGWKYETMTRRQAVGTARDGLVGWRSPDRSLAVAFLEEAMEPKPHRLRSLSLSGVGRDQAANMTKLGIPDRKREVALDAGMAYHALRKHHGDRREGKALVASDLAKADRIFAAAKLSKGFPFHEKGVWRVHIDATVDGVRYGGAFDIRRNHVVPVTLYRK